MGRVVATDFDSSHIAKLHEVGHSLRSIYRAADKRFGAFAAGKALREFVGSLKPNVNGQVVLAKADAEFLASVGLHSQAIVGSTKCASCAKHSAPDGIPRQRTLVDELQKLQVGGVAQFGEYTLVRAQPDWYTVHHRTGKGDKPVMSGSADQIIKMLPHATVSKKGMTAEYVSRVPHVAFHESNPDMLRTARVQQAPVLDASVIERYHKKGHSLEKIYKSATAKFGSAQASKAVKEFVASLKHKPIKVALSQIDCKFLKNKLADHNPIIGAPKCASCTYRNGMHCSLTGGTLLSFPNMDKTASNHKVGEGAPEDGRAILNEYDLMPNSGRPGDVKMADIDMNKDREDVHMGGVFEVE
jgi:hypothetical protein